MIKTKLKLNLQPHIEVRDVKSKKPARRASVPQPILKMGLLTAFVMGSLSGAGLVAVEQLTKAEETTTTNEQVTPTEPWSVPLDFSTEDLNIVADMLPQLIEETRHEPTTEELANTKRKDQLREYFVKRKSPFAKDDSTLDAFLNSKNMRLMIAISFVESTMGKKCYYNNCSGIGGTPPNLRKYDSYADWIKDFDSLLERRYKGLPIEKFMGLYVQPGSPNWINGVKQILGELEKQGIE
jgi:hypothetical protein